MDNQPVLSLCIPTNGAVQWVLPVLDSIYSQDYDLTKFEVVITDNGSDSQLEKYLINYDYPNLRYIPTSDEGFLNLVTSLKEGKGLFCKMINHRSVFQQGAIKKLVELVERYKDTRPIIYCASGQINKSEIVECKNIDEFVRNLSYYCSWSAGIGFWQEDIPNINNIKLNELFPNASMLFYIRNNPEYVIWNYPYQLMSDDSGKGGYDLFKTFGVIFLDIISKLRIHDLITIDTFLFVKKELYRFLCNQYLCEVVLPSRHSFIVENVRNSMEVYYGYYDYIKMVILARIKKPYILIKRLFSNNK